MDERKRHRRSVQGSIPDQDIQAEKEQTITEGSAAAPKQEHRRRRPLPPEAPESTEEDSEDEEAAAIPFDWKAVVLGMKGAVGFAGEMLQCLFMFVCLAVVTGFKFLLFLFKALLEMLSLSFRELRCRASFAVKRGKRWWSTAWNEQTRERLRWTAVILLSLTAALSACMAGSVAVRSIRTRMLNQELSAQFSAHSGETNVQEGETLHPSAEEASENAIDEIGSQEELPALEDIAEEGTAEPAAAAAPPLVKSTVFHQVGGEALPNMASLHERNRDLVAWLSIPEVLDLPVVYRDNAYYLKRDFDKQKNDAGTIFLDEDHPFRENTQSLLLHGHNMKDGTMFGRLTQYLSDAAYLRNHAFIDFSTLWKKEQYVIFAVLDVSLDPSSEDFFNYFTHSKFGSDEEFAYYVREMQLRSCYAVPVDVKPSDALLLLSTCLDEDRLVIAARRIREGETRNKLRMWIGMAQRQ